MESYRTTLATDVGIVHAVDMPVIPATYPDAGSVTPRTVCGVGRGMSMPASLARQTSESRFVTREVTCLNCAAKTVSPNGVTA